MDINATNFSLWSLREQFLWKNDEIILATACAMQATVSLNYHILPHIWLWTRWDHLKQLCQQEAENHNIKENIKQFDHTYQVDHTFASSKAQMVHKENWLRMIDHFHQLCCLIDKSSACELAFVITC